MRKVYVFILMVLSLSILFNCPDDPPPDYTDTYVQVETGWENSSALKTYQQNSKTTTRTFGQTEFEQIFNDYYAILGNKVDFGGETGLTPSTFVIGVGIFTKFALENRYLFDFFPYPVEWPGTEYFNVDLLNPPTETIVNEALVDYAVSEFYFDFKIWNYIDPPFIYSEYIIYRPRITVELPEYTDSELPDIFNYYYDDTDNAAGEPLYERKYIGNNQFEYTLAFLEPSFSVADNQTMLFRPYLDEEHPYFPDKMYYGFLAGDMVNPINCFVFNDLDDEIWAALPGHPDEPYSSPYTVDASHFFKSIYFNTYGNHISHGILRIPFDPVMLTDEMEKVTILFGMDVNNIIEVYDNNTPTDKTDDIVVMANGWWNRFHFTTTIE